MRINTSHWDDAQNLIGRPAIRALNTIKRQPIIQVDGAVNGHSTVFDGDVPSISFSTKDSAIWLNECNATGIPSIQLCDTQSEYEKITYPIIANQRSIPFVHIMVGLFSELFFVGLLHDYLRFRSFKRFFIVTKKRLMLRMKKRYKRFRKNVQMLNLFHLSRLPTEDLRYEWEIFKSPRYYKRLFYDKFTYSYQKRGKHTFMINQAGKFELKQDVIINYNKKELLPLFNRVAAIYWSILISLKEKLSRLSACRLKLPYFYWKKHFKPLMPGIIRTTKKMIIYHLGIRRALRRHRYFKTKFLSEVVVKYREIRRDTVYKMIYNLPRLFTYMQRFMQRSRKHEPSLAKAEYLIKMNPRITTYKFFRKFQRGYKYLTYRRKKYIYRLAKFANKGIRRRLYSRGYFREKFIRPRFYWRIG